MLFKVVDQMPFFPEDGVVYLVNDNWDDWFEFETRYVVRIKNLTVGALKIARKNQQERRAELPEEFEELAMDYFSLGTQTYYANLRTHECRNEILSALHDIALNIRLFEEVRYQKVTAYSLMRDITPTMVTGQFHRMATGGAELTGYDFTYVLPSIDITTGNNMELNFKVEVERKTPPSNIHVLVGKNGIGKTTILKRMIYSLRKNQDEKSNGKFVTTWGDFSNIVNVSFSAFDMPILEEEIQEELLPLHYTCISLMKSIEGKRSIKTRNQLAEDFLQSWYNVITSAKKEQWNKAIEILETDSTFEELHLKKWAEKDNEIIGQMYQIIKQEAAETRAEYKVKIEKQFYKEKVEEIFVNNLSSGHKIILLTLVKLIDYVEEKTLVLLDEPEEHLHPPLIAAFIRALSDLLRYRNGVAIIATHSPVIVQEVPKKCVWILRRVGMQMRNERPAIETFGENLGEITTEIFRYELLESGFNKMIKKVATESTSYKEALEEFAGELGKEAKAILKSYMLEKEND